MVLALEFLLVKERVGLGAWNDVRNIRVDAVGSSRGAVFALLRILAAGGLLLTFFLKGLLARALGLRGA